MSVKRVLIANRSEVALRVQATCHLLGLETVAIFSPEDKEASFVFNATQAFGLSQSGHRAYLAQEEIILIAKKAHADAVHPGYGFLSENALFAQKVIDAGLVWLGPDPSCITLMGDKAGARDLMQRVGVPIVPGFMIDDLSGTGSLEAKIKALSIGFPVIIKDPKGGGGKGMRRVDSAENFDKAWDAVVSESKKLTGTTALLIEKYIVHGRHIEIQVAGDGKDYIHLFERECSIQRRHQKIIEETPCNFVSKNTINKMYQAAIKAAACVNYNSIGTVEFIVTSQDNLEKFYFLEMNTRLQVEHAITEMTTGIDLVALQIGLALEKKLLLKQEAIQQHGHAIECRLYAEDPANNFAPATGVLRQVVFPVGPFIRIEHDINKGSEITPFFDPMIAKLVTYGFNRQEALERMSWLLKNSKINGVITNKTFLENLINSHELETGAFHTQLLADSQVVKKYQDLEACDSNNNNNKILAGIAVLLAQSKIKKQPDTSSQENVQARRWKDQQWS